LIVSVYNEQITPYFTSRDFSGKQYPKTIHIAIVMNTATNAIFVFFCLVIHSYSTVSLDLPEANFLDLCSSCLLPNQQSNSTA